MGDRRKPLEEQADNRRSKNTQEQEVKAPETRHSRVKQEIGCQDSQMCVGVCLCVCAMLYMLPHYTIDKTVIYFLITSCLLEEQCQVSF